MADTMDDVFGNSFCVKSAPQKTYIIIELAMKALRLLVYEIWWHSGHFFKWLPQLPQEKSGLTL